MSEIGEINGEEAQQISIPEGKFEAPGDYEILNKTLEINGRLQNVELIKQTFQGNCAEYTSLNTAIILRKAGFAVNQSVEEYLNNNRQLNLSEVEGDLTIPLLLNSQEDYKTLKSSVSDVDNLERKANNPYEPLTNTNSALLFRTVTSPLHQEFESGDILRGNPDNALEKASSRETYAVFIGSGNHATSWLKIGKDCYNIDPYFNNNVVKKASEKDMKNSIKRSLNQPGSFATINDLYTK